MLRKLVLFFMISHLVCQAAEPRIVRLAPPRIESVAREHCDRPMRFGGVNISVEQIADKRVVHCYGHGGFGYSTVFGSVQEAVALLMQETRVLSTPIRIIGSGCMGLALAIELSRKGYTNIVISTKEKYQIPSWRAGAYFSPGAGGDSAVDQKRMQLSLATYAVLQEIQAGTHPYLTSDIIRWLPIYYPTVLAGEVEKLEQLGLAPASESVTLDFGNGIVHEDYKKQHTFFIQVTTLMEQLWAAVETLQIPVVQEEITSFSQCVESVICNCSGGGSLQLNNDDEIIPVRGHFLMLKQQPDQEIADYMICTQVMQEGQKEVIYFFPKTALRVSAGDRIEAAGMLGGTYIPNIGLDEAALAAINEREFTKLAERAQLFFYGTK